jgi:hypothetical protein
MHKQSKTTFTSNDQPLKRFHFPPGHIPDYERLHNPQRFNRYCPCCIRKKEEIEKSPGKKSIQSIEKSESPPRLAEPLNLDSDDNRNQPTPEPVI